MKDSASGPGRLLGLAVLVLALSACVGSGTTDSPATEARYHAVAELCDRLDHTPLDELVDSEPIIKAFPPHSDNNDVRGKRNSHGPAHKDQQDGIQPRSD